MPDTPTDDPFDASDGQVQRAAESRMPHLAESRAPRSTEGQALSATETRARGATGADAYRTTRGASSMTSPNDVVEVAVSGIAQPVFVTREFLEIVGRAVESQTVTTACHPGTGARLGSAGNSAHRPPSAVVALVKQRDGHCRFLGCHVNARFCDLDHVRPWPTGPTDAGNLICLCRRHHRIKQRLGWTVRLALDVEHQAADLTRAVALRRSALHSAGRGSRLAMDVHRPHEHRPRADRFVLAQELPYPPGHRTSRHHRAHERSGDGDEPPF